MTAVVVRCGSRVAATSKMEHFVMIVNDFQPLTIITKPSILDVAAALDPPLVVVNRRLYIFKYWISIELCRIPSFLKFTDDFESILLFLPFPEGHLLGPHRSTVHSLKLLNEKRQLLLIFWFKKLFARNKNRWSILPWIEVYKIHCTKCMEKGHIYSRTWTENENKLSHLHIFSF